MAKEAQVKTAPDGSSDLKQKVQEVRELFADAPQMAKTALENVLCDVKPAESTSRAESAGRVGRRQGTVSELTVIARLQKAEPSAYAAF